MNLWVYEFFILECDDLVFTNKLAFWVGLTDAPCALS